MDVARLYLATTNLSAAVTAHLGPEVRGGTLSVTTRAPARNLGAAQVCSPPPWPTVRALVLGCVQVTVRPYDAFMDDLAALNRQAADAVAANSLLGPTLVSKSCPLAVTEQLAAVSIMEARSPVATCKGALGRRRPHSAGHELTQLQRCALR